MEKAANESSEVACVTLTGSSADGARASLFGPRAGGAQSCVRLHVLSSLYPKADVEEMGGKGIQTVCKWSRLTGEEPSQLIKDTDNIAVTALK